MTSKMFLLIVILSATVIANLMPVKAHSVTTRWIYMITSTIDTYELIRVSTNDNIGEKIYSVPKFSRESFATLMPEDEIKAVNDYAQNNAQTPFDLQAWLKKPISNSISSISISSNNQNIMLNLVSQNCIDSTMHFCFGASQLTLVSAETKSVISNWVRSFHSTSFLPKSCIVSVFTNIKLYDVRWTFDGNVVAASEYGDKCLDSNQINIPIIIIPLANETKAFVADEAVAWSIASDSRTLNAIVRSCIAGDSCTDSLDIVNFDISNQSFSRTNYSIGATAIVDQRFFGIHNMGHAVIFSLYDTQQENCCGIGLFSWEPTAQLSISPREFPVNNVRTSYDDKTTIFEDATDNSLWIADTDGKTIHTHQFLNGPTDFWQLGPDNMLLTHHQGDIHYSIINTQGQTLRVVDLSAAIKTLQSASPSNATIQATTPELIAW